MSELRDVLAAFCGRGVLIVGDVMLDEYVWGEARRISREAPVPIVEVSHRTCAPGGAANAAANVTALKGRAFLGGTVGRDSQAERLRHVLVEVGVDVEGLVVDDRRPTTTKTRVVARSHQVVRLDSERRSPLASSVEDALLQWVEKLVNEADVCVLSDYGKGVVSPRLAQSVIGLARQAGRAIVVDPKGTDFAKYRGATFVTPNVEEAERAVSRETVGEADLPEIGRQLLEILEGSAVLITRGPQGMSLFRDDAHSQHIPATARNVFDVTGAGDTVVATLAMALAAKATPEQAAYLASQAAGIAVGKFGTATVTLEELISDGLPAPP